MEKKVANYSLLIKSEIAAKKISKEQYRPIPNFLSYLVIKEAKRQAIITDKNQIPIA